jgi:predicted O-methyltransferase YrrM
MTNTLHAQPAKSVLERLFAEAEQDENRPLPADVAAAFASAGAAERAEAAAGIYMPVSARGGDLLYLLTRATRPATVVEFGTSFGISTLCLAAAVADNGTGHVYGTELSSAKIAAARANLAEAGLAEHATVLAGDARETLAGLPGPIGLVLLDGWKDLCLDVLRLLEPKLAPAALVVADDVTFASMAGYLEYVRNPENGYVTVEFPVEDGMEISCRVAAG